MLKIAPKTRLPLALILATTLGASQTSAQAIIEQFEPIAETAHVSGPYKRYFHDILKLSSGKYAVLFAPGYGDAETARRAVAPLCGAKTAKVQAGSIPVDLVYEKGEAKILHGIRVHCG